MTSRKHGRSAGTGRQRHQVARAAAAAVIQPLEDRRLMSLTVSLVTPAGANSAVATAVGQTITLDVVATVTSGDGTTASDGLQDVEGSFLSAAASASAVAGNLSMTTAGLTGPFNALGAQAGTAQDLNADGSVDVGSNDTTSAGVGTYFLARAGSVEGPTAGTVANGSVSYDIATVTYTVTALNGGGQTNINFRPRDTSTQTGTFASRWEESGVSDDNEKVGTFAAGSPFHVYTAASQATAGTVTAAAYADANGNGVDDAGEAPLSGVQVYVDLAGTGTYTTADPSAVTGTAGTATIDGVPAGTYAVRDVAPTGFTQTQPAAAGGYGSVAVTAGATTALPGPFGAEPDGSVSGTVYVDANGNGTDDAGESPAAAGVAVYLDVNHDGVDDAGDVSTTTFADGTFVLSDVVPGTYQLLVTVPAGDTLTQPTAGSYAVTVSPGANTAGETFGVAPQGSVTGTVFSDANANGTQDAAEAGLAGVTVYLDTDGSGSVSAGDITATTDSTGTYDLTNVPAGTYTLRDVVPAGDTQDAPDGDSFAVTVADGAVTQGGAFAVVVPDDVTPTPVTPTPTATGTISGTVLTGSTPAVGATVFLDANGNGVLDTAGTVTDVGAYTLTADTAEVSTTTDASGNYTFASLTPGTYTVRELLPLGYAATAPTGGSYTVTVDNTQETANDFTATALPASSLTTAVLTAPKSGIVAATASTAKVRVTNSGTTAFAGPVSVALYPSTTGAVAAQDAAVGTTAVKNLKLKAGKSATVTVKYAYPAGLAGGTYHLVAAASGVAADAPALAVSAGTATLAAATVDLKPAVVGTVALKAGKKGSVAVRLTNTGNVTATGTVTLSLTASSVDVTAADATAAVIGTLANHKMKVAAGRSVVVRVPYTAPTNLSAGSHDLVVTLTSTTTPADTDAADKTVTDVLA